MQRSTSLKVFTDHRRQWHEDYHYIYPVVSRRSKGLSIGVNVNVDKICNFDCVYCCVDRSTASSSSEPRAKVDLNKLAQELDHLLSICTGGEIWRMPPFDTTPQTHRRLNDIAFSGDGEPTTYAHLHQAVQIVADLKQKHDLPPTKIVLVTNATCLNRLWAQKAVALMDRHQGEIWAKLDAGTEAYYQTIDRTRFPLAKVLANILAVGRDRDIVIQSMFLRYRNQPVSRQEFQAYLDRLCELRRQGCRIKLVQLYTTARRTAEADVSPLTGQELHELATDLHQRMADLPTECYE